MTQLAFPDSFEYLCYGSTAIKNILILLVRDVFIRPNLMSTDDPRAERVEG